MADTIFSNVNCGFFPSQNSDRLYTADDMNKPYNRLVSNGVFATQNGTPSTDLQVLAGSGMVINVSKGQGLFGDKWFENPAVIAITVPNNTQVNPRIDAVIVQINTSAAVRAGRIIYRTGTAASNPVAPALNSGTGVVEYRLANVYVAASAAAITQGNITDARGSAECPWVTSLVQQVDTSTLFNQWQTAFQELYASASAAVTSYLTEAQEDWDDFFDQLTSSITAVANVQTLQSTQTASAGQTSFSINVPSYNASTDVLMVFINGLMARSSMYSVSGSTLTLVNALGAGDVVTCLVFKSLVTGDLSSVSGLITALDAKVNQAVSDTGWVAIAKPSSSTFAGGAYYRKVGKIVYLKGSAIEYMSSEGRSFGIVPYPPSLRYSSEEILFLGYGQSNIIYDDNISNPTAIGMAIKSDGEIRITSTVDDYSIYFNTSYIAED